MATEIDASRLLVSARVVDGSRRDSTHRRPGLDVELKAGDVAMWATRTLMDLVGPHAWSKSPAREVVPGREDLPAVRGTAEIQRRVISQMQVEEYRGRLAAGAEIAADAVGGTAAAVQTNGDRGAAEGPLPARRRRARPDNGDGSEEESKTTA